MIEHIWSVLCAAAVIDKDSNNISLLNVMEKISVTGPAGENVVPLELELVTLWGREDLERQTKGRARVRLLAPDNSQIGNDSTYDVDLTVFPRLRNRVKFNGFPVRGSGKYRFVVELEDAGGWNTKATVPLEFAYQEVAQAEAHLPVPQAAN